jgi:hypothetical protein
VRHLLAMSPSGRQSVGSMPIRNCDNGDNGSADNSPALRHSLAEQQWQEKAVLIRKRV